jgi:hypothetical protein
LFLLELNKLLKLLLLEFIPNQLNVLAEVSDLRYLLLFGLRQLLVNSFDVVLDLFLGLQQTLTVSLILCEVISSHVACIRLRI